MSNNILNLMELWETGEDMSQDEEQELFQTLIDNGMAWQLQGAYGRRADMLLRDGTCHLKSPNSSSFETTPIA